MRQIPKAALPIAAYVCGYPEGHRHLRQLLMIQAYVDDSLTGGEVLVLGGLAASVARWEVFSTEWQERLDAAPWSVFKMAEVWHRGSDEWLEHARWHYYTLRKYAQVGICMTVPLAPLQAGVEKYGLADTIIANPYLWAFKGIMGGVAFKLRELGVREPIDFFFDERPEEEKVRWAWDHFVATMPDDIRPLSGRKPIFEDDKRVLPLQGADMWAWWCRKVWRDNGGSMPAIYPIPWGADADIPRMSFAYTADALDAELARIASGMTELLREQSS